MDAVNLLIDVVMKPQKYYWIANVPGQFDAAEFLFNHHWNRLNKNQSDKVQQVLLRSGRYVVIA